MYRLSSGSTWAAFLLLAASGSAGATCAVNSGVSDLSVTQTDATTWTYDYFVQNGCDFNAQPLLTDFYVPYFPDAGISNIAVPGPNDSTAPPTTWSFTVEPDNNLFNLAGAGVIDFHVTSHIELLSGDFVSGAGYYGADGFTYTSAFGPVDGPSAIRQTAYDGGLYDMSAVTFGDPSIPASPDTLAALNPTATPEPGFLWLLATGLCAMIALKARDRRTPALNRRTSGRPATDAPSPRVR